MGTMLGGSVLVHLAVRFVVVVAVVEDTATAEAAVAEVTVV